MRKQLRSPTLWFLLAAMAVTIGCDQATKRVAKVVLEGEPSRAFLGDTVRLDYAENTGAFLSLGADLPDAVRWALFTLAPALFVLALAAAALLEIRARSIAHEAVRAGPAGLAAAVGARRWSALALLGATLLASGGASNWLDRALRGHVIDFLNVGVGSLRTGIFNVADVAIMAGAGMLLATVMGRRNDEQGAPGGAEPTP